MEESMSIEQHNLPHIVVCPSAGMGHLLPFLRISSMFSSYNCKVTLMTIHPTLSTSETTHISSFLASHPHIHSLETQLPLPSSKTPSTTNKTVVLDTSNAAKTIHAKATPDPFFVRYTAISYSAHLLAPHLVDLCPPPTAILCDFMFLKGFNHGLGHLNIPLYVLPITSSKFFALTAFISHPSTQFGGNDNENDLVIAPSMTPIPKSSIPPPFLNPNHIFTKLVVSNSSWLYKCKGIVLYSFDFLEHETLRVLREGRELSYIPPIFDIGPLKALHDQNAQSGGCDKAASYLVWLDEQPRKSVVYANFGSRTAMAKEQIRELGHGLEMSGVRFLWVVKTTEVDNQEKDGLVELLGEEFIEKVNKGKKDLILKEWVDQDRILNHPSVGGFLTHCGWNSVTEAARLGLPMLGWPLHGDQKINADVVAKAGLGIWENGWGWLGERLVVRQEIGDKIKVLMMDEDLRESARRVGEEASKAWDANGSSTFIMSRLIQDIFSHNS